jgi:hypothetical protein
MLIADKDCPTEDAIETVRRQLRVEKEIDRLLTRKMRQRSSGPYLPLNLDTLKCPTRSASSQRSHKDRLAELCREGIYFLNVQLVARLVRSGLPSQLGRS